MKIHTYLSKDAPPASRALARILEAGNWLPISFPAADEEAARERAKQWWDRESEKFLAKTKKVTTEKSKPEAVSRDVDDLLGDDMPAKKSKRRANNDDLLG